MILGCSPELLNRLQERLDVSPPSAPPLVPGSQAKRLADLQASLARAQSHQLVLKDQHDAMEIKLTKARQALADNSDRIATLTAEVVAAKAEISPPASVNHMDSGDEDNQSFQSSEDQMLEENEYPEEYEPVRDGFETEGRWLPKPKAKSTAGDDCARPGQNSRIHCGVTRLSSSNSSGVSSHACVSYLDALLAAPARAPAAFTAARRVAPSSAVVGLGMHDDGSPVHDACSNSWSDTVWVPRAQGGSKCTFPSPGSSWYPIRVTWIRIGHQAIDGLDEGVWNRTVGDLSAKG